MVQRKRRVYSRKKKALRNIYSRKRIHHLYKKRRVKTRKQIKKGLRRKSRRRYRRVQSGSSQASAVSPPEDKKLKIKYQLITDADDTLHPAGSGKETLFGLVPVAGVDIYGDRHKYYPCVILLHQEIYKKFGLPTVIVSADPRSWAAEKTASKTKDLLGEDASDNITRYPGSALASLTSSVSNILARVHESVHGHLLRKSHDENWDYDNYQSMATIKVNSIEKHVRNEELTAEKNGYEYRAIWIGDNGQGDLLAAKQLLNDGVIYAALIHYVDPRKPSGKSSAWYRGEERLFSFTNYKQAIENLNQLDPERLGYLTCADPLLYPGPSLVRQTSFGRSYDKKEHLKQILDKFGVTSSQYQEALEDFYQSKSTIGDKEAHVSKEKKE